MLQAQKTEKEKKIKLNDSLKKALKAYIKWSNLRQDNFLCLSKQKRLQ